MHSVNMKLCLFRILKSLLRRQRQKPGSQKMETLLKMLHLKMKDGHVSLLAKKTCLSRRLLQLEEICVKIILLVIKMIKDLDWLFLFITSHVFYVHFHPEPLSYLLRGLWLKHACNTDMNVP